jgi:hypothetical protein
VFYDVFEKFETLQKEQNIKVHITSEEIVDAFKVVLRQNCKHYFLQSQFTEEVRAICPRPGRSCLMVPPFPYKLEFVKDVNFYRVYSILRKCKPKIDVSERSIQRITGRLECNYRSSIKILNAETSSETSYRFDTIVLFILI